MQSETIKLSLPRSYLKRKKFRNNAIAHKSDGRGREFVLLSVITVYSNVVKIRISVITAYSNVVKIRISGKLRVFFLS